MIKIENVATGFDTPEIAQAVIRGMRNPMNSWDRSDSGICKGGESGIGCDNCAKEAKCDHGYSHDFVLGKNDYELMKKLAKAGSTHAKYRRMIPVSLYITAPLYWWKEFDTYKVGTVANSCSTMHKIHSKEFTLEDFSCEQLIDMSDLGYPNVDDITVNVDELPIVLSWGGYNVYSPIGILMLIIDMLNKCRKLYLETKDKQYWWQMIQLLPSSYNQKRTVMLNYEVLANIYHDRKNHKLDEWREFCEWIKTLPYSELITGEE